MTQNSNNIIRNLIVFIDFVIVNGALSLYYYEHYYNHPSLNPSAPSGSVMSLSAMLLCANLSLAVGQMLFATTVHKHYRAIDLVLRQVALLSISFATLFICLLDASKFFFSKETSSPEASFTIKSILLIVTLLLIGRIIEYGVLKKLRLIGHNTCHVVFAGEAPMIARTYKDISLVPYAGLDIMGYYSDQQVEDKDFTFPHLGTLDDLKDKIKNKAERMADDIYCTEMPVERMEIVNQLVEYSMVHGIQFNFIPKVINDFGCCLKPRMEGDMLVLSNLNEPLLEVGNRMVKRTFDIVVSIFTIIFMLPLIPIIGLIIKMSSPGPIFFKQKRTGLNGTEFYMIKFRSMHVNKDADRMQAKKDDPRKFAFGNFMRKTNIDELPQFFNVLVGNMSIVGPRPHMLAHTDEYRKKIHEYMLRHLVRPGITGWAQVTGFRGETAELWQMSGRVERDLWYIQNWSFWLDIRIIWHTIAQCFKHDEHAY